MIRIVLAVIAGFALWSALSLISNAASTALAPDFYNEDASTDSVPVLDVILVLSVAFSIGSGVLTARPFRKLVLSEM